LRLKNNANFKPALVQVLKMHMLNSNYTPRHLPFLIKLFQIRRYQNIFFMKINNVLFAFLILLASFKSSFSEAQNVNFGISTQKACNSNHLSAYVSINGSTYTTDESGSYSASLPAGNYRIAASTTELPNSHIAYAEYWVNGIMQQKFIGDESGAINAKIKDDGNLFIYLACDEKKIKVKIATTKSCTDDPNEGFSAQGGVSVSIGDKTFTSDANGVIDAEIPAGNYPIYASWKDYALGYIAQNGLRQNKGENGGTNLQLTEDGQTLEVRMLTCDPNGSAKARARVTEIGNGTRISVNRSRASGNAFVGMQLRDGDTVIVHGTAKLTWLDGNATISFDDPQGSKFFIIGPNAAPTGIGVRTPTARIGLLQGLFEFAMPRQSTDPGDQGKFQASNHTVVIGVKGTRFTLRYDEQTKVSTVVVKEGEVYVDPVNPSLRSFTLNAGQQVQIGETYIGPVTSITITNNIANIGGTWFAPDGQTVRINQNGYQASWNYSGGRGHENLRGTVTGTIYGDHFTGTYNNREGNNTSSGNISLMLNMNNNRLEGAWTSSNNSQTGNYILTKNNGNGSVTNVDISGTWYSSDGQMVQIFQKGNQVNWSYNHGGKGHENLTGNVSGTFDGKNLNATYHNYEGNNSSDGSINLVLNGDRLDGNWYSTRPLGQSGSYILTRNNQTMQPDNVLVGNWTWAYAPPGQEPQVHNTVIFNSDGTFTSNQGSGKWVRSANQVTMYWPASTDDLTLSADGNTLTGQNKDGWKVRGTRIRK
jgi:hypothetical protein